MPTSNITGPGGSVSLPTGFNGKLDVWSASLDMVEVITTGFDDGGNTTGDIVEQRFTGSATATGQFDGTSTAPIPSALLDGAALAEGDFAANAKGSITLTAATGCTYAFTANITSVAFNRAHNGKLELTFNFASDGPITQTWDETA